MNYDCTFQLRLDISAQILIMNAIDVHVCTVRLFVCVCVCLYVRVAIHGVKFTYSNQIMQILDCVRLYVFLSVTRVIGAWCFF